MFLCNKWIKYHNKASYQHFLTQFSSCNDLFESTSCHFPNRENSRLPGHYDNKPNTSFGNKKKRMNFLNIILSDLSSRKRRINFHSALKRQKVWGQRECTHHLCSLTTEPLDIGEHNKNWLVSAHRVQDTAAACSHFHHRVAVCSSSVHSYCPRWT